LAPFDQNFGDSSGIVGAGPEPRHRRGPTITASRSPAAGFGEFAVEGEKVAALAHRADDVGAQARRGERRLGGGQIS